MTFSSSDKLYEDFLTPKTTVFDERAIGNAVRNILQTAIGGIPGRPSFGSRINELAFTQNDSTTRLALKRLITEALSKWEKRIVLTNITFPETSYNNLVVKIDYYFTDASINSSVSVSLLE
jgi:hypothetical protein